MRRLEAVLNALSGGGSAHLLRTREGVAAKVLFHAWQDACSKRAHDAKVERDIAQKRRTSSSRMHALTNGGAGGGGGMLEDNRSSSCPAPLRHPRLLPLFALLLRLARSLHL